jgi:hypothetical protein
LLRNTWTVVRIHGQEFGKFAASHSFARPVDQRCVDLAKRVSQKYLLAESDMPLCSVPKKCFGPSRASQFHTATETNSALHLNLPCTRSELLRKSPAASCHSSQHLSFCIGGNFSGRSNANVRHALVHRSSPSLQPRYGLLAVLLLSTSANHIPLFQSTFESISVGGRANAT